MRGFRFRSSLAEARGGGGALGYFLGGYVSSNRRGVLRSGGGGEVTSQ